MAKKQRTEGAAKRDLSKFCAFWAIIISAILFLLKLIFDLVGGSLGTVGTVACYFVFPWALGLIANWTGGEEPTPMYVDIDGNAVLFIAINAVVMALLIICGKLIMKAIEKRKALKQ